MKKYDKWYMPVFVVGRPLQRHGAHRLRKGPPMGTTMHKQALYREVSIFWERWQVEQTHTHFMGQGSI